MKKIIIPALLSLLACSNPKNETPMEVVENPAPESVESPKMEADFNGDGKKESAELILTVKGQGNPQTDKDYKADEFELKFSDEKLPSMKPNCCNPQILLEGDLNGDKSEEISLISYSPNGTQVTMETYTFKDNKWTKLVSPVIEPGVGTDISMDELQKRVFSENNSIFYMNSDAAGVLTKKALK
jgi:hypothetical protein